jgi:hypothetical protein
MKIEYNKHKGSMCIDTGIVTFYDMTFSGIEDAVAFLKDVNPEFIYKGRMYHGYRILCDVDADLYYTGDRWWPDEKDAIQNVKRVVRGIT